MPKQHAPSFFFRYAPRLHKTLLLTLVLDRCYVGARPWPPSLPFGAGPALGAFPFACVVCTAISRRSSDRGEPFLALRTPHATNDLFLPSVSMLFHAMGCCCYCNAADLLLAICLLRGPRIVSTLRPW